MSKSPENFEAEKKGNKEKEGGVEKTEEKKDEKEKKNKEKNEASGAWRYIAGEGGSGM